MKNDLIDQIMAFEENKNCYNESERLELRQKLIELAEQRVRLTTEAFRVKV